MRTKRAGSKWPGYVLGGLVLVAIVLMIVTPREPPTPGPIGVFGYWKSTIARGTMSASAVNPAGTMWAGAWNETTNGKTRSAVWIIDFKKEEARSYLPKSGPIDKLSWSRHDALILPLSGGKPGRADVVDAVAAKATFGGVLSYPTGSSVTATSDKQSYSYKISEKAEPKLAFTASQLPGLVENTWPSPAGILVLCRHMDDFTEMVYDSKTGKLNQVGKNGYTIDIMTNWPDAPKEMLFVTYRGGFKVDLASCKATKVFDYSDLTLQDDHWRNEVQDGRLYPRKDRTYVSVSNSAGTIDIRILGKDGRLLRNLLARS